MDFGQVFKIANTTCVGCTLVGFDDKRDAQDAIRELYDKNGWRVEISHNSKGSGGGGGSGVGCGGGRGHSGDSDFKCYQCGDAAHFACECRGGRRRSRSPATGTGGFLAMIRGSSSYNPHGRSLPRPSVSLPRKANYSKSPPPSWTRQVAIHKRVKLTSLYFYLEH